MAKDYTSTERIVLDAINTLYEDELYDAVTVNDINNNIKDASYCEIQYAVTSLTSNGVIVLDANGVVVEAPDSFMIEHYK